MGTKYMNLLSDPPRSILCLQGSCNLFPDPMVVSLRGILDTQGHLLD